MSKPIVYHGWPQEAFIGDVIVCTLEGEHLDQVTGVKVAPAAKGVVATIGIFWLVDVWGSYALVGLSQTGSEIILIKTEDPDAETLIWITRILWALFLTGCGPLLGAATKDSIAASGAGVRAWWAAWAWAGAGALTWVVALIWAGVLTLNLAVAWTSMLVVAVALIGMSTLPIAWSGIGTGAKG